jgi:hypothetical protein
LARSQLAPIYDAKISTSKGASMRKLATFVIHMTLTSERWTKLNMMWKERNIWKRKDTVSCGFGVTRS